MQRPRKGCNLQQNREGRLETPALASGGRTELPRRSSATVNGDVTATVPAAGVDYDVPAPLSREPAFDSLSPHGVRVNYAVFRVNLTGCSDMRNGQ